MNGDDAMKKEYLEETDEATEKLEDKQEAESDDGITVESVDSEENEIEIEGIESDYAESVASDNEEPNTDGKLSQAYTWKTKVLYRSGTQHRRVGIGSTMFLF